MPNKPDRHLTEEELLRYADGEIPQEQSWISRHLLACWECRGRLSDLEAAIKAIIQFRNNDFLPAIPTPPKPWADIKDHLRFRAVRTSQQSFWNRIFSAATSTLQHRRAFTAAAIVVGCVAAGLWLQQPPAVSASAVLAKAVAAESAMNHRSLTRIVHQRFRVRKTTRHDGHETLIEFGIWRGPKQFRLTAFSTGAPVLKDLEALYNGNGLNWHDPLSSIAYSEWRTRLVGAHDAVTPQGSGSQVAIQTSARSASPSARTIHAAEITFRKPDYHVIDERFSAADTDYEITETHWDLLPEDGLPVGPAVARASRHSLELDSVGASPQRQLVNDDEVEMEIRHALHHLGADLGDPITVGRGPEGEVVVEVLGVTPERLGEVEDLLHRYPTVIFDRTGSLLPDSQTCNACGPSPPLSISGGKAHDFDPVLLGHFGGASELQSFIHEILSASDRALAHAYALRVLASRYGVETAHAMAGRSKQQLWEMIASHAGAIAENASEVANEMRPLLREVQIATAQADIPEELDWQKAGLEVFGRVQNIDRLLKVAFTNTNSSITAAEALQKLTTELPYEKALLSHYRDRVEKECNSQ